MNSDAHPVAYGVEPQLVGRNRLTAAFRIILAIPHAILIGGPGFTMGIAFSFPGRGRPFFGLGSTGVIGAAATAMGIVSWFAIVFTGRQPKGLRDFIAYYLRWRARAVAYMALLRDEYPPFGDGEYAAGITFAEAPDTRNRLSVGLRLIYVIPHVLVLIFIGIAWLITAIIGWFAILFTGAYPAGLYRFGVGYLRWSLRVEAYLLLMHDEYPPFSLDQ
jgi:hypothetical protein